MQRLSITEAPQMLVADLISIRRENPNKNLVIGVSGPVASGKSRFSKQFLGEIESAFKLPIIYLPFDYWINIDSLDSPDYAGRFFLDDFAVALKSISEGEHWLCPRYDLAKLAKREGRLEGIKSPRLDMAEIIWQERRFKKLSSSHDFADIEGGSGIYFEPDSKRLFTLFFPKKNAIYFADGTMIFANTAMRSLYTLKVYLTSSWVNRVARMIRRYNRKEVFGKASSEEKEYVSFLAREAKDCADREIADQIDNDMIFVESSVETISNFLDLHYLKQKLQTDEYIRVLYSLTEKDVESAISKAFEDFKSIVNVSHLKMLRDELKHLIESRHLLSIQNTGEIFNQLSDVLCPY